MKFILEFACFQGWKLSQNRIYTIGLTITFGDVTGTGVGIGKISFFHSLCNVLMQCAFAGSSLQWIPKRRPVARQYHCIINDCFWCPGAKSPGHQYPQCWLNICCGFVIWSVLWLSHFVLFSMSRYIQPIRAIFDRDIMRAYGIYISEMICHILVIWCCQQNSV